MCLNLARVNRDAFMHILTNAHILNVFELQSVIQTCTHLAATLSYNTPRKYTI